MHAAVSETLLFRSRMLSLLQCLSRRELYISFVLCAFPQVAGGIFISWDTHIFSKLLFPFYMSHFSLLRGIFAPSIYPITILSPE